MVDYGQTAVVRYTGMFDDGDVFDSTDGIEPLEFEVGSGQIIHGFDEAVMGMSVGETLRITIPAREAYGEYDERKIQCGPMYALPNAKDIKVGKLFYFVTGEKVHIPARVLEINEGIASIDFNHPLAGKDLTYEIELLAVRN